MKYFLLIIILYTVSIYSQNGYALYPGINYLPDTSITAAATALPVPTMREDVRAVGMGKTQTANGKTFNAMIYNPALLIRSRFSVDVLSLSFSLPPQTYDAARFLNDHLAEFKDALSLRQVWQGVTEFRNADNVQDKISAIRTIQQGLIFPRDLLQNVIGTPDKPETHGIKVLPAISLQAGNFGFTLYALGQSAFEVIQSPVLEALLNVPIPDNFNDPQQLADAVLSLEGILQPLQNMNSFDEALPFAYSVSYVDIVAAAGYAFHLTPGLSAGLNLKVVHRRFSAKKILYQQFNDILNIFKRDLNQSVTGFTFDVGALYKFPFKTEAGLSIQNLIPVQKISSTINSDFIYSFLDYRRDANGQKQITPQGDTLVQSNSLKLKIAIPFDLELPLIINFGINHPITPNWDISFEWADLTKKDILYVHYGERFRLGTEYRLDVVRNKLITAFRLGTADNRLTVGLGFNVYNIFQLDGAYAYDNYAGAYSYYAQIRFGW